MSKSQVVAGGLAFCLWMVLSAVGALPKIGDYLPGRLTVWAGELVKGDGGASWMALGVSLGLIVITLTSVWMVLERQEL